MTEEKKQYELIETDTPYQGFFNLVRYRLRHTLYAGGWSQPVVRELFQRGNCVAVLLYDPHRDSVILIEQFRVGALKSGDSPWLLEIVAGAIEPGETALEVAYRESLEEAGCEVESMIEVSQFYTSPGGASEKITLFCGKIDSRGIGGVHGLDEEDEDILVSVVTLDDALEKVNSGAIDSAIPILALQWLAMNRDKVLSEWCVEKTVPRNGPKTD